MTLITNEVNRILLAICTLLNGGCFSYENKGSKIFIRSRFYFLEIFQQERYDQRLSCLFNFDGYKIFFEHVYEAIEKDKFALVADNVNYDDYNEKYLISIFEFIESNLLVVNEFPPKWFLDAVEISSKVYSNNFPELAVKYKDDGFKLWNSWAVG